MTSNNNIIKPPIITSYNSQTDNLKITVITTLDDNIIDDKEIATFEAISPTLCKVLEHINNKMKINKVFN